MSSSVASRTFPHFISASLLLSLCPFPPPLPASSCPLPPTPPFCSPGGRQVKEAGLHVCVFVCVYMLTGDYGQSSQCEKQETNTQSVRTLPEKQLGMWRSDQTHTHTRILGNTRIR